MRSPVSAHARRRHTLTLIAAVATLALAACSSGGSGSPKDDTSTLTVALPGSLSSLDPATEAGILNYYVASITSEGLLGVGGDGSLQPAIAESWTIPDASTYVFEIRQDARFADGSPVTVEDVLYSIDRARDPVRSPGTGAYWPEVTSVEKTADWEVTITLAQPSVAFIWTVTNAGALWITSEKYAEAADTVGTATAPGLGTGPYRAVEFAADSHATFEGVDTWWGGASAYDEVRFEFIPDENTRLLARTSGDVDVALNVPLDQLDAWDSAPDTDLYFTPDHSYVGLIFDQDVAPFGDEHVRAAISHAIDRDAIVSSILRGHGQAATGIPAPDQLAPIVGEAEAAALLAGLPQDAFDLDSAKAELAQSSVPDGFSVKIAYPNTGPQLGRAALAIADNLAKIGITLEVTEVPIEQWFTTLSDETVGLHFTWYFSTTGDPAEVIGWYLRDGNPFGYTSTTVSTALAAASVETDDTVRIADIIEANRQSNVDRAALPLWWGQSATAVSSDYVIDDYTPYLLLGVWPNLITPR